jgi:hypothetical protein
MPKGKFPPGILVIVQEKRWMDTAMVQDWIKTVWNKRLGALLRGPALVVWNSFRGHFGPNTAKQLPDVKTDVAIIPDDLTPCLQPLDVSVDKLFKGFVRKFYTEWMAAGGRDLTLAGKIKRPSLELLCHWILGAWNMISPKIIVKSFLKTGISNVLEGSKDDAIWFDGEPDDVHQENALETESSDSE